MSPSSAFQAYLKEFGARVMEYSVCAPNLGERPEVAMTTILDFLARLYDPAAVLRRKEAGRRRAIDCCNAWTAGTWWPPAGRSGSGT